MSFPYIDPEKGSVKISWICYLLTFAFCFIGITPLFFDDIFAFLKKPSKLRTAIIAVLILVISSGIYTYVRGGSTENLSSTYKGRIIILGYDGLSPKIVNRLMSEGKLPNFSRLMKQGSYHEIASTNPSQSPVAWTGIATGQNGGKHGIFDFIKRNPADYSLTLATSDIEDGVAKRVVKSKSFWQYASDKGVPSVLLAFPISFPPDEIKGRMTSGMGTPDILGTEGTFTYYTSEPQSGKKETGGKVVQVDYAQTINMDLYGPKKQDGSGKVDNIKVPFTVTILPGKNKVKIDVPGNSFELAKGQWSDWNSVAFSTGLFKKMRGIYKMYLTESEPELKLYVSPINLDPRDPAFPISYPSNYGKELVEETGFYHTQGMPCDTWALNEKRLTEESFLTHINDIDDERLRQLYFEMNRFNEGILYTYFETSDIIQHMFWRYTDPKSPLYEKGSKYTDVIDKMYIKLDGILGEVMNKMKPTDTIIVLSDHGFDAFRRSVHVNAWLRKNGYLQLTDPNAKEGGDLLADIDWFHTKAYAIGFGAIYINQSGREGSGIVEPGAETEKLKKEISAKLLDWKDEKDGAKIINNVYIGDKIFKGDYANEAPDLYIGFNSGFRASWQTALGNVPSVSIEDNEKKWSGDHLVDPAIVPGILFSNKKLKDNPSLYDIAPTILKMIGYSDEEIKKCDFDGKPLI